MSDFRLSIGGERVAAREHTLRQVSQSAHSLGGSKAYTTIRVLHA